MVRISSGWHDTETDSTGNTKRIIQEEASMTVWADDAEKESALQNNVQIEIGCDTTDIWFSFNKATSAVQMTHAEAKKLMEEMSVALEEAEAKAFEEYDAETLKVSGAEEK
jgi:hypothetical protein